MENAIPLPTTWFVAIALFATVGLLATVFITALALGKHSLPVPGKAKNLYAKFRSFMRNGLNDDDPKQQLYHYGPFKWWAFALLAIELPLIALLAIERYPWESAFPFGWYDAYKTSGLPFDILAAFAAGLGIIIAIHRSELSHISHERDRKADTIKNYFDIHKKISEQFEKLTAQKTPSGINYTLKSDFMNFMFQNPNSGDFSLNRKLLSYINDFGKDFRDSINKSHQTMELVNSYAKSVIQGKEGELNAVPGIQNLGNIEATWLALPGISTPSPLLILIDPNSLFESSCYNKALTLLHTRRAFNNWILITTEVLNSVPIYDIESMLSKMKAIHREIDYEIDYLYQSSGELEEEYNRVNHNALDYLCRVVLCKTVNTEDKSLFSSIPIRKYGYENAKSILDLGLPSPNSKAELYLKRVLPKLDSELRTDLKSRYPFIPDSYWKDRENV